MKDTYEEKPRRKQLSKTPMSMHPNLSLQWAPQERRRRSQFGRWSKEAL